MNKYRNGIFYKTHLELDGKPICRARANNPILTNDKKKVDCLSCIQWGKPDKIYKTHLDRDGKPYCGVRGSSPILTDKKKKVDCRMCVKKWQPRLTPAQLAERRKISTFDYNQLRDPTEKQVNRAAEVGDELEKEFMQRGFW